jgi:hypothetical protein
LNAFRNYSKAVLFSMQRGSPGAAAFLKTQAFMKNWFQQYRPLLWALFCSFALCAFAVGVYRASQPGTDRFDLFSRIVGLILTIYYTADAWWRYRQHKTAAKTQQPTLQA